MLTISAISLSGGQGKSTVSLFLAKMLAEAGYTVLAIDADPQGNLTTFLRHDLKPTEPTLLEVIRGSVALEDGIYPVANCENLFLIPADDALEGLQDYLSSSGIGALMMKQRLQPAQNNFDICMIDSPPQRFQMSKSVIGASDQIVIPVTPNVKGFGSLIRTTFAIEELAQLRICNPQLLAILPFCDDWTGLNQTIESKTWLESMKDAVDPNLFLPAFRESTKVERAISTGQSLSAVDQPDAKYPLRHPFDLLVERIEVLVPKREMSHA